MLMTPARRSAPTSSNGWFSLLGISGFGAIIFAGLVAYHTLTQADNLQGLRGIVIRPGTTEELTVHPKRILRLAAFGDFATMEIPIRADWSLTGDPHGSALLNCINTPRCRFRAGQKPGIIGLRASVSSFIDTVTITVSPL